MNNAVQFSQKFANGRINLNNCDLRADEIEFLKLLLDGLRWNVSEGFLGDIIPESKEVYFDYIKSNKHEAFAKFDEFKAVGINYGLALNLYKISALLLNCTDLFEDLDVDEELYSVEEIIPFFSNSFEEIPDLRVRSKPISEERTMMASIVARIAYYFVVGHELGHIRHAKTYKRVTKEDIVSEFSEGTLFDSQQTLDIRTLELDADVNGSLVSYWLAVHFYQAENSILEKYYSGPSYVWMISIFTLLFSYEKAKEFYYPEKTARYPPAYIRQNVCLQQIKSVLENAEFAKFFKSDYKPDFNLAISFHYDEIKSFFGSLGMETNKDMEQEFEALIHNLAKLRNNKL